MRGLRPEVVHTHSGKAGLLGRLAAWRLHVPAIVHTVHGAPFHPYQSAAARFVLRNCERFAAARCDAIVSVADAMTEQLVAAGVAPAEKFQTVYSGLEVEPLLAAAAERAALRRQLGYGDEQIVVGKIARLFHLKGHEYLIAAAERAVQADPRLQFLLVGDGLLAARLHDQIDRSGLGKHFRFAGLVPPERIPAYLAAMDIVVHTSLREGLARVLPQALIAGKPVISYDIDGAGSRHSERNRRVAAAARNCRLGRGDRPPGCRSCALRALGCHGPSSLYGPVSPPNNDLRLRTLYTRLLTDKNRGGVNPRAT